MLFTVTLEPISVTAKSGLMCPAAYARERQGSVESPPAFVWYFDWVMKVVKHRVEAEVGSTGPCCSKAD